uniref:Extracellular solute-binding protein, family 3 n=1 Tax=Tanacetum cinerariifolium TaxID=118510 RepID=A0A699H8R6_TANCI|nr:extracellular solute-binding protein, family 3 [Tanacetum cinerariifolium]
MLCVYCLVDFSNASIVTEDRFSKLHIKSTYIRKRRSIKEQGDTGQEDVCAATLSSWLTLDQLRPRVPTYYGNAGYQDGSFLKDFIMQKWNCSGHDLLALESVDEYKNAFSNGSVKVIFDELPYIDLFLAKYGSSYMKFGPINQESGIAFRHSGGLPGDLSLWIPFPDDLSPGKRRWGRLVMDSFPDNNP